MIRGDVSLTVLVHGRDDETRSIRAREYLSPEDRNTYIEGREGAKFTLRIENRSPRRVVVVPTIDGLSVRDGKAAHMKSGGYVLEAHASVDVPGWAVDSSSAAAFRFAGTKDGADDSYVARNGGNVEHKGVIGVRIFAEHRPPSFGFGDGVVPLSARRRFGSGGVLRATMSSAPSMSVDDQTLGTAFGERVDFSTHSVPFRRGEVIDEMALFYDDERGLRRRGIDVSRPRRPAPNPFPGDMRGCVPPPGWTG
jgi:hypothetical protein